MSRPMVCLTGAVCLFPGPDALRGQQELCGARPASAGGLLPLHQLLCVCAVPPHGAVRQRGSGSQKTGLVSGDETFLLMTSALFKVLKKRHYL